MNTKKKLGIALGGGGPRGMAHIGALQALEDNGIKPDVLSGTSVGAVVGALYAFGVKTQEQKKIAENISWWKITRLTLSKYGITNNSNLSKVINKYIGENKNFSDSQIPIAIITCDISTGKKVILKNGNIIKALLASSSLPGIFTPVMINKMMLVDGGLVENVPISPLKNMGAEVIVGIDLMKRPLPRKPEKLSEIISNSFYIMLEQTNTQYKKQADIMIEPDLPTIIKTDKKSLARLYKIGYEEMSKNIAGLKKLLK